MQPLPSIGAPIVASARQRQSNGGRRPHAPRPTRALPLRIRACGTSTSFDLAKSHACDPTRTRLHLFLQHKQKSAFSIPRRAFLTTSTSAVRARVRPLPSTRSAVGLCPRPARRPGYARAHALAGGAHDFVAAGVDAHPIIDTGAHRIAEADAQIPRDGRGLRAYPHPIVTATEEHDNRFVYSPHAFAEAHAAHALATDSNAQRESTFAYNPHAFAAVACRVWPAPGLECAARQRLRVHPAYTPRRYRRARHACPRHLPECAARGRLRVQPTSRYVRTRRACRRCGYECPARRRLRGISSPARTSTMRTLPRIHMARMVRVLPARRRRHGCAARPAVLRACPGLLPASHRRSPAPARKVDGRRRGGGGLSRVVVADHAFSWAHGGVADAGAVWTDDGEGAEHPRVLVVGEAEEGFASSDEEAEDAGYEDDWIVWDAGGNADMDDTSECTDDTEMLHEYEDADACSALLPDENGCAGYDEEDARRFVGMCGV
ncbi:hypothetical protein DFH09DRAFT_487499 [Mycena vulgaris]|nr:hypothetical protein DFH09DRAFT_487499 [Mycena vulgaris]